VIICRQFTKININNSGTYVDNTECEDSQPNLMDTYTQVYVEWLHTLLFLHRDQKEQSMGFGTGGLYMPHCHCIHCHIGIHQF
jgi:hypothetical protein